MGALITNNSDFPPPSPDIEWHRLVAARQRSMLWGILAIVGAVVAAQRLIPMVPHAIAPKVGRGFLASVAILQFFLCYRLADALRLTAWAYAIFSFVPCLGMLVLLIVNQKATRLLKNAGYSVGFMGAQIR